MIGQRIRDRLVAHAYRFAFLPLTSVPSAAVSDDDTQAWSAESYATDLDDEGKA